MSTGWEGLEAAPLEDFHSRLMELFHEWRIDKYGKENAHILIDGVALNNLIAKAKTETYNKYPKHVNCDPVPEGDVIIDPSNKP